MSEPTAEARPSTPFSSDSAGPAAGPDPLDGDWSEGLRGPVRALGIPAPRLLSAQGHDQPEPVVPVADAPAPDEAVEAPDAWSVADDDPLHSVPPPVAARESVEASHGGTVEGALEAASAQHAGVAALAALPAEPHAAPAGEEHESVGRLEDAAALDAPDSVIELPASDALDGEHAQEPADFEATPQPADSQQPLEAHEGVVELPAAEALDAHDGELLEPEPLAPFDDGEEAAPHAETAAWAQAIAAHAPADSGAALWTQTTVISSASAPRGAKPEDPQPEWGNATPADPQPAWGSASPADPQQAWRGAERAEEPPAWARATPAEAQPARDKPSDAPVPAAAWAAPLSSEWAAGPPAASSGPAADWTAVSSGPDWSAPAAAPALAQDGWGAPPPAAPESAWAAASPAAAVADWQPPAVASPSRAALSEAPLTEQPQGALFAPLAQGESLSTDEPVYMDSDPDLPVPFEGPELPKAPPRASLGQIEPVPGLAVDGEHRVAVHTRGGRTLRGSVRDIDLAKSQFTLLPQGGSAPEAVYHAEVKAIFFMLAPGEKPRPASGARVRVTFADGRAIDGTRDGGEGQHGFFLVPADAARTNTRRIYVSREAISDLKDG